MPRGLPANEQATNIAFVQEIEKCPCIYNYKLDDYSKRDIVDSAWEKVARAMDDTVANCREKWRNLRTVFVRKQKLPPNSSGRRKSKPYYLNDVMQFIIPYLKIQNCDETPSNISLLGPTSEVDENTSNTYQNFTDRSDIEEDGYIETTPQLQIYSKEKSTQAVRTKMLPGNSGKLISNRNTKPEKTNADMDSAFLEYFQENKKMREPESARKLFLLSIIPDVEKLTELQFREFRRKVLDAVDYPSSYQDGTRSVIPHSTASTSSPGDGCVQRPVFHNYSAINQDATNQQSKYSETPVSVGDMSDLNKKL